MPPAGLEPAALCLASSIRLSLTARQSWGCWLDYILDITVPTRIVSEDPNDRVGHWFPADYPILEAFYLDQRGLWYRRLSGRPRIQGRPLNGFRPHFPIKAPTRQMLYPLSYRGTFKKQWHVSTSKSDVKRDATGLSVEFCAGRYTQKEIARRGRSLLVEQER